MYDLMLQKHRNNNKKNDMAIVFYKCVYMQAMFACISLYVII